MPIPGSKSGGIERYVKKIRYIFPCHWIGKNRMVSYLEKTENILSSNQIKVKNDITTGICLTDVRLLYAEKI